MRVPAPTSRHAEQLAAWSPRLLRLATSGEVARSGRGLAVDEDAVPAAHDDAAAVGAVAAKRRRLAIDDHVRRTAGDGAAFGRAVTVTRCRQATDTDVVAAARNDAGRGLGRLLGGRLG